MTIAAATAATPVLEDMQVGVTPPGGEYRVRVEPIAKRVRAEDPDNAPGATAGAKLRPSPYTPTHAATEIRYSRSRKLEARWLLFGPSD